ncbi:MAG: hypothetical protein II776_04825, partial [Clostridia bacterium]|nr:hypothetical protein [Clostridia bacterium]
NTCRSPMAEALLNDLAGSRGWRRTRALSAGLYAEAGAEISRNARLVLERTFGITGFRHAAQPMTKALFDGADAVIGMTENHAALLRLQYGPSEKIFAMPVDVGDPWGGDAALYEACARQIVRGIGILEERGVLHD